MEQVTETRPSKGYFRSSPSTAFDQYLQDIQKLPLIQDPEEERRLARRAQKGDEKAAERLVTAMNQTVPVKIFPLLVCPGKAAAWMRARSPWRRRRSPTARS